MTVESIMKVFILFFLAIAGANGAYRTCENSCRRTFPHHTYPKRNPYYACLRGCRLDMIDQVSKDWNGDLAGPEKICEKDCAVAYESDADLKNSCLIGCRSSQLVIPARAAIMKEEEKAKFHVEHYYLFHPLLIFKRYCSGLFNVAVSYIIVDTSITVKDGEAVRMDIQLENVERPKGFSLTSHVDDTFINDGKDVKLTVHQTNIRSSWLDCVSYKAGIPKWLLATALFSAITAILYLCCCTCWDSANDEKRHKFEDVFTIDIDSTKLPLYTPDEAPLLPPKYSEKGGIL